MMQHADFPRLDAWFRTQGLAGSGAIRISPLSGGQSNPTFVVEAGRNRYVLRKKPAGPLQPSAHAIDREYRVMHALRGSAVPVPRMFAYCDDTSIIGTPFYVMEYVEGRVMIDQSLPGMTPQARQAIYAGMNRVITTLHGVDVAGVGLGGFGRTGNYFSRQIGRWSKQCRESTIPVVPAMRRLMEWLPERIPDNDETTLVHGDFRLDNLVFHPTEPRVLAVLDWELSTLGHPLADLAYHCMSWRIAPSVWRGIAGLPLATLGIPAEAEYIGHYEAATGRRATEHWDFYLAYNLFRMAAILHGIGERAAHGNAAAKDAVETAAKAAPLAELGWACAQQYDAGRR
ncbi:phosphotransferase family protein [Burkholderia sp. Ac-20353]|uniref:phosphotransferase family protein n=1 Tax=Burkholderia sp. Ac-20353 TaxID=2703894 RepID=UPI00197BB1FE|nr:phosphotransferase family protein [Burkholderia sp. Ac-20353]MBN3791299.1 phosphotransferase family protein [Burkholderia sp. Ac-20353]